RLVAISRGPLDKLLEFRKRMGWSFPWYSSQGSDFNFDFGVSFVAGQADATYNFQPKTSGAGELPGLSAFLRDAKGTVYHTYSTYARGLDIFNTAYNLLDMTAKGRDEDAFPFPMAWVKHRDKYA